MQEEVMQELIIESASKVHSDWCKSELEAYHKRVQKEFNGNIAEAFQKACYKNGNLRNEVEFDVNYLVSHTVLANESVKNFNDFMVLFNLGAIKVKRFTKRNLTPEEQNAAGRDFRNGEENILRPFTSLSHSSKEENLSAAIGAVKVYIELAKAGVTIDEMKNNNDLRHLIGIAIHLDWLKRNTNHPNDSLKVPYDELDEWTQQQDLTVYDAMLDKVLENQKKYFVKIDNNAVIPDYMEMEKEFFGHTK